MPTQDEVFEAIKSLGGWATYARLRKFFGIEYNYGKGNSNSTLPQRLNALRRRGRIVKIKSDIGMVFVVRF